VGRFGNAAVRFAEIPIAANVVFTFEANKWDAPLCEVFSGGQSTRSRSYDAKWLTTHGGILKGNFKIAQVGKFLNFNNMHIDINFINVKVNVVVYFYRESIKMPPPWVERLASEDISFIKRFLLASGSLKKVAQEYGISYPTVRLRLDRLIQKIEIFDSQVELSEFERQLRAAYADGKLDQATFERLLAAHRQDENLKDHQSKENSDASRTA